ncbi:MAG: 3-isopropylmalate dehydrogenase [Betaproteobacteria bacterium]|nr:3-isopropylmalate dehydrogenase [Betaproteobacteria bacterium]
MTKRIAVLAGDGIGPEITEQCVRVLQSMRDDGLALEFSAAAVGGAGYDQSKDPLPAETLALCEASDAILFGSVGGPQYDSLPRPMRPEQGLLRLRKHFDLFANLRPAIVFPELAHASSLKAEVVAGLDLLILRELTSDIYFLSDEASMLTGSIGMLPSASLNDKQFGLYEPIHGSAPDIAGKGLANPLASILSAAMMLRYSLDLAPYADRLESAVRRVLAERYRTADIQEPGCKLVGTVAMADAVIEALGHAH